GSWSRARLESGASPPPAWWPNSGCPIRRKRPGASWRDRTAICGLPSISAATSAGSRRPARSRNSWSRRERTSRRLESRSVRTATSGSRIPATAASVAWRPEGHLLERQDSQTNRRGRQPGRPRPDADFRNASALLGLGSGGALHLGLRLATLVRALVALDLLGLALGGLRGVGLRRVGLGRLFRRIARRRGRRDRAGLGD